MDQHHSKRNREDKDQIDNPPVAKKQDTSVRKYNKQPSVSLFDSLNDCMAFANVCQGQGDAHCPSAYHPEDRSLVDL